MKLFCVALILVAVGAQPYTGRREKPGFCPPFDSGGECVYFCSSDDSCPGNQKCCDNGCGRSCQVPTEFNCAAVICKRPICSNPVRAPGQCCGGCYGNRYLLRPF